MNFDDLTPELKEKALACKTSEELLELAKREGYELTEEELESMSGGGMSWSSCDGYVCSDHCARKSVGYC